jgi:Yip1 domain
MPEGGAPPQAAPGPDSAFGRLVGVFVSPVRTVGAIARKPTWLLPVAIATGLALPLSELILSKTDWRAVMIERMAHGGRTLTEGQMDMAVEQMRRLSWMWDVFALLVPLAMTAAIAGILWASCQAFGWEVRFPQSLGVTAHAFLPGTLKSLALLAVLWNRESINPQTVEDQLRVNLGFLAGAQDRVLHGLLSSLDLFSFWTLGLLVLGVSAAAGASRARAAALVLTLWGLFVLGKAGVAAIF